MEIKEMNLYQKISMLQDNFNVSKSSYCEFANFKYRSIQDILAGLKPKLKELGLIIRFGAGALDNDKYTLNMYVVDINTPDNQLVETGEIYIDRSKAKMDLSQKVLSAKTFLKKSLLEDLLLIEENVDPDSHDNTGKKNTTGNTTPPPGNNNSTTTQKKQTPEEEKKANKLKNILYFASNKNNEEMIKKLSFFSEFKNKQGKIIKGYTDFSQMTGNRLDVTYNKIIQTYPEILKKVNGLERKK